MIFASSSALAKPPTHVHNKNMVKSEYSKIVKFEKGKPLTFADFTLTYLGQRYTTGTKFTFVFEQFEVTPTGGGKPQKIEWTSGTGEIAPQPFEVGGQKFFLDLRTSEIVGHKFNVMKIDELVIRPAPPAEK